MLIAGSAARGKSIQNLLKTKVDYKEVALLVRIGDEAKIIEKSLKIV